MLKKKENQAVNCCLDIKVRREKMKAELLKKIENKELTVGVVGLGYVGLPLAVEKK